MPLIKMSDRSKKLMQNLYNKNTDNLFCIELLEYLDKPICHESATHLIQESLRAALLYDLQKMFLPKETHIPKPSSESSWFGWLKWGLLAIAGTIYAACDGFDGITTILALFPTIPLGIIFAAGFAFALLSVFVFYGFYLVDVSEKLEVKVGEQGHLIDVFLEQSKHLKQLLKISQMILYSSHDLDELETLGKMVLLLDRLYTNLQEARDNYEHQLQNPYLNATKTVTSIVSGILFFGYGFFGGQSLALTMLGLVSLSPTAAFWPVIMISIAVGLAAFSVYWLVERPGLEKLVSRFFGLDESKIDLLPEKSVVEQQKINLAELGDDVKARILEVAAQQAQPLIRTGNIDSLPLCRRSPDSLFVAKNDHLHDPCLRLFSNKKMSQRKRSVSLENLDQYIEPTIPLYTRLSPKVKYFGI